MPENDPFEELRSSGRTSSTRALDVHKLTQRNISRVRKCHCSLPYTDEFKNIICSTINILEHNLGRKLVAI